MNKTTRLYLACIIALVTTAFGFIVRAFLISDWGQQFDLSDTQIGALQGAGLFPVALSIILFSFVVDRFGYGRSMAVAWIGHVTSAIVTMTATSYTQLYIGTFIFALSNGVVEAVVNPITATLYPDTKTQHLNILHSGWAGGLVLGGLLALALGSLSWQWKIGLFLLPALIYGGMMLSCRFPVQERVAAGVSYRDMLREFGWSGCAIASYFVARAFDEVARGIFDTSLSPALLWTITLVPPILFAWKVRRFGRPVFVILLLVMILSATTELGTDSWVTALLTPVLVGISTHAAAWLLIYTSAIMLVLRLNAGKITRCFSPLAMLAGCSALAAAGLFWLAHAGAVAWAIFLAATLYGVGKSFFWPTTLAVVSEQFPRGGALTLNAIGGIGMIAVGVVGTPLIGVIQDSNFDHLLATEQPALHAQLAGTKETKFGMTYRPIDKQKVEALPQAERAAVGQIRNTNNQAALSKMAVLPVLMLACYLGLLLYYRSQGGYRAVSLVATGPPIQ